MSHIDRKIREKENLRKKILEAALGIATAEGWQAVTVRRISEAIEYTTSIIYGHFDNKEALLNEIVEQGFQQLYSITLNALQGLDDPQKKLLAISLANWDFAMVNKELYHLMFNFKKPSGKSSIIGMDLIEKVFEDISGKKDLELRKIILNWICLRRGCLNLLMEFTDLDGITDPRALYTEYMERFIASIIKN